MADMQWAFAGPFCELPDNMVVSPELACPVIVRLNSTHDYASEEVIVAMHMTSIVLGMCCCASYVLL